MRSQPRAATKQFVLSRGVGTLCPRLGGCHTREMSSNRDLYRGRLAPSPTGGLHLGVARTSLVAWLRARKLGGRLVLRVEDIDGPRVVAGSAASIAEDLRWLGLDWDEGPDVGGPHRPYVQSERTAHYAAAIESLRARGLVYPCTCSRKDILELASAPHGDLGAFYPGTCRNGPTRSDRPPALRLRVEGPVAGFVDRVHGPVPPSEVDDFVLQRGDGVYAYQLVVVVDDIAMGVTEVVRGDDLLPSTPRQLALYRALESRAPEFLHVPLVLAPDQRRMSKRDKAPSMSQFRAAGIAPERVIGELASSLGLAAEGESLPARALIDRFELDRLPRTPAVLDALALLGERVR